MTTIRAAAGAAALLTAVAFGATGCSSDESSDTPTTAAAAEAWDPCTLSDETLREAGLDPTTQGKGSLGPGQPGWNSCEWKSADKTSVVMGASATATVEQFRNGPGNIDIQEVTVAGRPAITHREDGDEEGTFCWLVVPFQGGGVMAMQVARSVFTKGTTPMCEWAVSVGDVLVAEMPR